MFKNKGFVQLQWYAAQNLYFLWKIFGDENRPFCLWVCDGGAALVCGRSASEKTALVTGKPTWYNVKNEILGGTPHDHNSNS